MPLAAANAEIANEEEHLHARSGLRNSACHGDAPAPLRKAPERLLNPTDATSSLDIDPAIDVSSARSAGQPVRVKPCGERNASRTGRWLGRPFGDDQLFSIVAAARSRAVQYGTFVISLDFELLWGVRDKRTITDYGAN
ncbi:MAG: hypothetical protein ACXU85_18615, partial [Xanthobacteraceae bacterium]